MARKRKKIKLQEANTEISNNQGQIASISIDDTSLEINLESSIPTIYNEPIIKTFDGTALYKDIKIVKNKKVENSCGPKFLIKLSFNRGKNLVKFFIKTVIGVTFENILNEANKFYFTNKNKVNADSCLIEVFDENHKLVLSKMK